MKTCYERLQEIAQRYLDETNAKGPSPRSRNEFARYEFIRDVFNAFADDNGMDWGDEETTVKLKSLTRLANAIVKG